MNFVAFQEFSPRELRETGRCIWCGEIAPANRAHIISKKLTKRAIKAPVLRFRVCETCNSLCGELELWILRRTPLNFLRNMLYAGATSTSQPGPLHYFYSETLEEWVTFRLDPENRSYRIDTQLVLASARSPVLLTEEPEERHIVLLEAIRTSIQDESATRMELPSLPYDFSPRLVLGTNKVVVIAKEEMDASRALKEALHMESTPIKRTRQRLNDSESERHHFRWSRKNWARFCAKTALETLCLFEGGEICLGKEFDRVREFVLKGTLSAGHEVIFDGTGPVDELSLPVPVYLDLTNEQKAPEYSAQILSHTDPGCHVVLLYEIHGWVMASVVFAGLPSSVLVLAGPDAHLGDIYQLLYDHDGGEYHFLRLAHSPHKPIVPLPLPGDRFRDLIETYRLRPA